MRKFKSILALLLSLVMLLCAVPTFSAQDLSDTEDAAMPPVGVISDIHYYPESLTGDYCDSFLKYARSGSREPMESIGLLDSALYAMEQHAKENGMKYLLLPGDLTKDGEYAAHTSLAQRLELFEEETGIQVIVTNGNHDINNSNSETYESGKKTKTRTTKPEEFKEIYKNLGFDLAYNTYTPPAGKTAGMLSYSVNLDENFRLIVIDSSKYSADNTDSGIDEHETGGKINEDMMDWILDEIDDAKKDGQQVVGMSHHSIAAHAKLEYSIFEGFVIDDFEYVADTLANAGMHYVFTGHLHLHNVASATSDEGETIYDIQTPSLTGYPNKFREVAFSKNNGKIEAKVDDFDVDCEKNVVVRGTEYEAPFKETVSFGITFGKTGLADLAMGMLGPMLDEIAQEAAETSLSAYVNNLIDFESVFDSLLGGGISLGGIDVFTSKNIMAFINDLLDQVDKTYLQDPDRLTDLILNVINTITEIQVSELPCTAFIDTLGFGDANKPGTFEDLVLSVLAYFYDGNENIENDAFLLDALETVESVEFISTLLDVLVDLILDDILFDELFANLQFNLDALFPKGTLGHYTAKMLDTIVDVVLWGDTSYTNLVNFVFNFKPMGFDSVRGILEHYMDEYLDESQLESVGIMLRSIVDDLLIDEDPGKMMDGNTVLVYDGPVEAEVSKENFRLPSTVAITFGDDAQTTRNFSWFTRYSVTGTAIEIVPYSENPKFTGVPTTKGVKTSSEEVGRIAYGIDLGIVGIRDYTTQRVRHLVEVTGLEPGEKYCYRIGDADKGWWSEPGVISTADGSDEFTFFHMTDPQSQNTKQYSQWKKVLETAFDMFPDSQFIVSTGDHVDNGSNSDQWQWLLDLPSETLKNTVIMPASGNHEKHGDNAIVDNFNLTNLPQQDTTTGAYYSFDYNNAHFAVLNSNDLDSNDALSAKQIEWLTNDMNASDAQWKFVALHKAVYSNGSHFDDSDVVKMRGQLSKLMPELGIDMVFQGHDHVYLRTDSMVDNKVVASKTEEIEFNAQKYTAKIAPEGSIYVISGCSGVKTYNQKANELTDELFPRAEAIFNADDSVFSAVQIKGDTLYFDAYMLTSDGTQRIDQFAISKSEITKPEDTTKPPIVDDKTTTTEREIDDTTKTTISNKGDDSTVTNTTEAIYDIDAKNPKTADTRIIAIAVIPLVCAAAAFALKKKKSDD